MKTTEMKTTEKSNAHTISQIRLLCEHLCKNYIADECYQRDENGIAFMSAARIAFNDNSFSLFDKCNLPITEIKYSNFINVSVVANAKGICLRFADSSRDDEYPEIYVYNA